MAPADLVVSAGDKAALADLLLAAASAAATTKLQPSLRESQTGTARSPSFLGRREREKFWQLCHGTVTREEAKFGDLTFARFVRHPNQKRQHAKNLPKTQLVGQEFLF